MITIDNSIVNEILKIVLPCVSIGFILTAFPCLIGYVVTSILSWLKRA